MKRSAPVSTDVAAKKVNSKQVVEAGISLVNIPPHHFHLGDSLFAKVSDFNNTIRVHLRRYRNEHETFFPTKNGITMSALTFLRFKRTVHCIQGENEDWIFNRELIISASTSPFPNTSFIFEVLSPRINGFRRLNPNSVKLTSDQFDALSNQSEKIWDSITNLLFGSTFRKIVLLHQRITPPNPSTPITSEEYYFMLMEVTRDLIQERAEKLFFCVQCYLPPHRMYGAFMGHKCEDATPKSKFKEYFKEAVAMLDPKTLAESFAETVGENIPHEAFLEKICGKDLLRSVEKM